METSGILRQKQMMKNSWQANLLQETNKKGQGLQQTQEMLDVRTTIEDLKQKELLRQFEELLT